MAIRWGGKIWLDEYEARETFGISPETLMLWKVSSPLVSVRLRGKDFYEEQSLRACTVQHQGGKR